MAKRDVITANILTNTVARHMSLIQRLSTKSASKIIDFIETPSSDTSALSGLDSLISSIHITTVIGSEDFGIFNSIPVSKHSAINESSDSSDIRTHLNS